jgi:hypothetical protein
VPATWCFRQPAGSRIDSQLAAASKASPGRSSPGCSLGPDRPSGLRSGLWLQPFDQSLELLAGDDAALGWDRDDHGSPVRSLRGVRPFPSECPGELADPGGIEDGHVDFHLRVTECGIQGLESLPDQPVILGRQLDPVFEVVAVAGVDQDGLSPSLGAKKRDDLKQLGVSEFLFPFGGGDGPLADRIDIDEEPGSLGDIPVTGGLEVFGAPGQSIPGAGGYGSIADLGPTRV